MEKRNLKYEKNFRTYLYKFDFKTHKEILKELGIYLLKYQKAYNILMGYWENIPDEEREYLDKELKKIGL